MANIKWRKKDELLLKKKVKAHNDKIARNLKKGVDPKLLPEKLSYKKLKNDISTREQFNTEVELINSFTARYALNIADKSERGAVLPVYKKQQIETKLKVENKTRREQRKIYETKQATDRNKPIGKTVKEDADNLAVSNLRDRKFNFKNMSQKELDLFVESLGDYKNTKNERHERYKENYIEAIRENLNPTVAEELIKLIESLDADTVVEKYYTDRNLTISFIYEPQEEDLKFSILIDSWNEIAKQQE